MRTLITAVSAVKQATITHRSGLLPTRRHQSMETSGASGPATASLNPRWLSDVKQRIGKCFTFGLKANQVEEAGRLLQQVARDWRELVAGSEGFLTDRKRTGLIRRRVIWGEQDSMGHVNNVMYNRYAETGRVEWARKYGQFVDPTNAKAWNELVVPSSCGLILRKITTEFKFPMKWPDHISVYHKLGVEPGPKTDAFFLDVLIMSELHQRPVARVVEDCVLYDYTIGKKTTFPPFMVEVLQETWRLQEEAKRVNSERVRSILDRVRTLEIESWDRENAVEDMGSRSG